MLYIELTSAFNTLNHDKLAHALSGPAYADDMLRSRLGCPS